MLLTALILLFVIMPIVEIYVLLTAGGTFGVLPVLSACVVTAILGGALIRLQGAAALMAAQRDLAAGKPPVNSAVDGALLVVAAPLLMTPGFVTDALGFLLLVPPVRRILAQWAMIEIKKRVDRGTATITINRP